MRRRWIRIVGTVMIVLGLLGALWVLVVWQWKDPFTSLYTLYRQHQLSGQYDDRVEAWRRHQGPVPVSLAALRQNLAEQARRYRKASDRGEVIGKIVVPRLGVDMYLVNGTDEGSLEKGPGRDLRSYMPGERKLVYIAGHRTTFLAPFADIEDLRPGDPVTLELPYGTFRYAVSGHRVVPADDLSQLRSPGHEVVRLQACHPRFFASQRYLAYALPVSVELPNGRVYRFKSGSGPASLQASSRTASASRRS